MVNEEYSEAEKAFQPKGVGEEFLVSSRQHFHVIVQEDENLGHRTDPGHGGRR